MRTSAEVVFSLPPDDTVVLSTLLSLTSIFPLSSFTMITTRTISSSTLSSVWFPDLPNITGLGLPVVGCTAGCPVVGGTAARVAGLVVSPPEPTLVSVKVLMVGSEFPGRYALE